MAGISIASQMSRGKKHLGKRYKANKFIAYFQSFSNTYAPVEKLKSLYDEALQTEDVVGLSIGTRPDCVNSSIIDLVADYAKKRMTWMEYGLQTVHDKTLALLNRGHDFARFEKAVASTKNRGIKICAHVILGLPYETKKDMLETAEKVADMGIDGVKLHLLYVIKGTRLERMLNRGEYECLSQRRYLNILCDFLERLPPDMIIQRLTGEPHQDELAAPMWALKKRETLAMIDETLEKRDSWQGKVYNVKNIGKPGDKRGL